jgi:penicillin amidase
VKELLTRNLLIHELYMPLTALRDGLQSSNNWAVAGFKTKSGKPIFENDPHLPHMSPPLAWGVEQVVGDHDIVGFTIPGIHMVVFGHNYSVAWGATINNVDLQDLYVEKEVPGGYEYDGAVRPFEVRVEEFKVKGSDPVTAAVRYTLHGPLINDLDSFVNGKIPATALRTVPLDQAKDAAAIRGAGYATNATEFVTALSQFDSACINWTFVTVQGDIGYSSPCRVPIRKKAWGTFPVPGWVSTYEWQGFVPKAELPSSLNPKRGWIATANNQAIPFDRYPTAYDNDPAPPNRYLRISEFLERSNGLTATDMAHMEMDTSESYWPAVRKTLPSAICGAASESTAKDEVYREATAQLCAWDGMMASDSTAATLFVLLTNAMLDRAMADELTGGAEGAVWHYIQAIPHFELNVHWLWARSPADPVWDDVRTKAVETRADILTAAMHDAVRLATERYGDDMAKWKWGTVRPFFIKHPFGTKGGILGTLFNGASFPGVGGPETVFKNQWSRSDRQSFHAASGPAFRLIVDMGAMEQSGFELAGGESGWAKSPHYGDLTQDWSQGKLRPLSPKEGTVIRFEPAR